ncbi:MAG: hypothetical protein WCB96_02580 [Candidatus Aminicenantales bacterium]
MDLLIFEDNIKYDAWAKLVLVFSLILLIVLGILFYIDGHHSNIFPKEPPRESRIAFVVLCFSIVLTAAVYWFFLPRKIAVSQDGIKTKFGGFSWNLPFQTIESIETARGLMARRGFSCITSYKSQIVIVRKNRLNIRISPNRCDQFVESATRALANWKHVHPAGDSSG